MRRVVLARTISVVVVAFALGIALIGAPAAQSVGFPFEVTAAKKAGGPYTPDTQEVSIKKGKTKLLFWKVTEGLGIDQNVNFNDFLDGGSPSAYKIAWFKGKKPKASHKITQDINGDGYDFKLKADKSKYITASLTAKDTDTLCFGGEAYNEGETYSDSAAFRVNGVCH
jgi:hypothetical protein